MSEVLKNLQEFRREKEAKKQEKSAKVVKLEESGRKTTTTTNNSEKPGSDWRFLTTSEPVAADYEESESWITPRIALAVYLISQALAVWAQFGAVFFILALIVGLYWNTGRRRHGEMSAYSVFNQGCERLAGSMTAEHFERDMLRQWR